MKETINAFFYQNEYYLFPEGVDDVETLRSMGEVKVLRLKKDRCLPPDFKYEETEETVICVSAPAYPVAVNLWRTDEYDERLVQCVKSRCVGCARFSGDETDLDGHYTELSQNGVCYLKKSEDEPLSFGEGMRSFLYAVAKRADEIKRLTDENEQEKLSELVCSLLNEFFVPLETFGAKSENGQYCVCFSAKEYEIEAITATLLAIVKAANAEDSPTKQAGLFFYPFFPREIYKPRLSPDYFKNPPRLFFGYNEGTDAFEISVYEKNSDEWSEKVAKKRKKNAYRYLCSLVGEDLLSAVATRVQITWEIPVDKTETDGNGLWEELQKAAMGIYGEEPFPFPTPFVLRPLIPTQRTTPFKENFRLWVTVCPELAPSLSPVGEENEEMFQVAFQGAAVYGILSSVRIGYAYVYLENCGEADVENRIEFEACFEELLESQPLRGGTLCVPVGTVSTEQGICLDFLVYDENAFFDLLSRLTPILIACRGKIVTVQGTESMVYDVGYEITPVDGHLMN